MSGYLPNPCHTIDNLIRRSYWSGPRSAIIGSKLRYIYWILIFKTEPTADDNGWCMADCDCWV